ncbi:MAG TPA: hypothetical protein VNZ58_10770 [Thermomicrobiales bacterium]|nr:hypothetical protein [Thermomicrobiales bacterium]
MNTPFRPNHADELNVLLDAMRSGSRAPEPSSEEPGELAHAASQFRDLADRAAGATPAPSPTFDAIWEDMMSAHATPPPTLAATGPTIRLDDARLRVAPVREMPRPGWLQSLVSAAILVVLLAGMVVAAWNLRDGNGGTSDPGNDIRLAAPGLDPGTPEAPADGVDFSSYIDPLECTAKRVTPAERQAARAEDRDWWEGEFGPVSQPDADDARAAASVAREFKACERYIVPESLMTERMLGMPALSEASRAKRDARERTISTYLADIAPSDVFLLTDQTPTGGQSQNPFVFIPATAVQFPDGRIGIPASFLIPRNDPTYRKDPPAALMTEFDILKNESGEWLLDEQMSVCIGTCTHYINGGGQPFFDLRVNPDLATPIVRSAMPATPFATPVADREWTDWITFEECTPQATTIWAVTDTRDYALIGPANPDDAIVAVKAARILSACTLRMAQTTPGMYNILGSTDESFSDRVIRQQATGEAIANLYPIVDPSDYFVFTDETPGDTGNANLVFEPRHAIALADGRIIIPGTWLIWTGDSSFIQQAPDGFITQAVVMTESGKGQWTVTENLPICLGNCDDIWPYNAEYSSIRVSDGVSPVSSPET